MKKCLIILFVVLLTVPLITIADVITNDTENLTRITTTDSFKAYLENQTRWYNDLYPRDYYWEDGLMYDAAPMPAATSGLVQSAVAKTGAGATDYSTTNVQVAGVDEADYLKNDGKYIYLLKDDTLIITDVFPPDTGKIVSKTAIAGDASALFLNGDRLVVFSSEYGNSWKIPEIGISSQNSGYVTHETIYDITDRTQPHITREITLPGSYENGRMIGDIVYAITRESLSYNNPIMPVIYDENQIVARPSIWCPPIPMNTYELYTITSFDLAGNQKIDAESFLLGYDNTLYVSQGNAYIAYKKWNPYWWGRDWGSSSSIRPDEGEQSVVHRFSLNNGTISYEATGMFPGHLLNQFSLDESGGNLRVATTNEQYRTDEWIQDNNVYVLSPALDIIGRLEHLASGEKIYSARFMGDLLYLVTFKQTDPLFVIDLSNPKQPGILGELKIPGYSDYLHPYDQTHLIGIGKATEENDAGGIIPTGVKLAFFDVSDLNNPKLVDSRVIGEKGSSSEVLSDHKAFLLDGKKSLMVLPIKEVLRIPIPESRFKDSYTTASWQGAYVFGIDPATGFIEKGTVEQDQVKPNDYYWSGSTVRRSMMMDSVLYTVSDDRIIGSDIGNLDNRLMLIDLPGSET